MEPTKNLERITPLFKEGDHFETRQEAIKRIRLAAFSYGFDIVKTDSHDQDIDDPKDTLKSFFVFGCIHGKDHSGDSPKTTKKLDCEFYIRVKDHVIKLADGKRKAVWQVRKIHTEHNHDLLRQEDMSAYHGFRALTESEKFQCIEEFKIKTPAKDIAKRFSDYRTNKIVLNKDISNLKAKYGFLENGSMENVTPFLLEMEQLGYIVKTKFDTSHELSHLFFIHQKSLEMMQTCPEVLIVDATYKTNYHEFPLINAVGIGNTAGKHYRKDIKKGSLEPKTALMNYQVALAWVANETEASYLWFFTKLKKIYDSLKVYPEVIITDRGKSVVNASKKVFPSAGKMLCAWHIIAKNLYENCRKAFEEDATYDKLKNMVWELQSSTTESRKSANLEKCNEFADKKSKNPDKVHKFLKGVMRFEKQWIKCYVDKFPHMETYTTGRGESQHSAIKIDISSLMSLKSAFYQIEGVLIKQREHWSRAKGINMTSYVALENANLFKELKTSVSNYALQLLKCQILYAKENKEQGVETTCTGRFTSIYKLPCKHSINLDDKDYSIPLDSLGSRWRVDKKTVQQSSSFDVHTTPSSLSQNIASQVIDFDNVPEKLAAILYKLEAAVANESVESNQLEFILQLEKLHDEFTASSSQETLMPSQQSQRSQPKTTNGQAEKKEKRDLLFSEKLQLQEKEIQKNKIKENRKKSRQNIKQAPKKNSKQAPKKNITQVHVLEDYSPNVERIMSKVDLKAFTDNVPEIVRPHIQNYVNVEGDGNCGFRAVALALGLEENLYLSVRMELKDKLAKEEEFFRQYAFFKYDLNYEHVLKTLEWISGNCLHLPQFQMLMPYTGYLIAETYNRPVVVYNRTYSYTILPRRFLGDANSTECIALMYVSALPPSKIGHFWYLKLSEDCPIPTKVFNNYDYFEEEDKVKWDSFLKNRIITPETSPTNNTSSNPIDLENVDDIDTIVHMNSGEPTLVKQQLPITPLKFVHYDASSKTYKPDQSEKLKMTKRKTPVDFSKLDDVKKMKVVEEEYYCFECSKNLALKCGSAGVPPLIKVKFVEIDQLDKKQRHRLYKYFNQYGNPRPIAPIESETARNEIQQEINAYYETIPRLKQLKKTFCEMHIRRRQLPLIKKYNCSVINFTDLISQALSIYDDIGEEQLLQRDIQSRFEASAIYEIKSLEKHNPRNYVFQPGFYGSKGVDLLNDCFTYHKKVIIDYEGSPLQHHLNNARAADFITFLLVPEICVRVFQAKYNVTADEAEHIIKATSKIGHLYCKLPDAAIQDDEDDVVDDVDLVNKDAGNGIEEEDVITIPITEDELAEENFEQYADTDEDDIHCAVLMKEANECFEGAGHLFN